jgi:hypothetical protein
VTITTPNWDTNEVDLWISNDEYLYDQINGKGLSAGEIRLIVTEFKRDEPALRVDMSQVSWSYLRDEYRKRAHDDREDDE